MDHTSAQPGEVRRQRVDALHRNVQVTVAQQREIGQHAHLDAPALMVVVAEPGAALGIQLKRGLAIQQMAGIAVPPPEA